MTTTNKILLTIAVLLFSTINIAAKPKPFKELKCGCIIDETAHTYKCGSCGGFLAADIKSVGDYMDKYGRYTNIKYECKSCHHFHILAVNQYGNLLFNYKPAENNVKQAQGVAHHTHTEAGCIGVSKEDLDNGFHSVTFTNNCPAKKKIVFTIENQGYKISLDYGQSWSSYKDGVMFPPGNVKVKIID